MRRAHLSSATQGSNLTRKRDPTPPFKKRTARPRIRLLARSAIYLYIGGFCDARCGIARRKAQHAPRHLLSTHSSLHIGSFRHAITKSQTTTMQNCTWAFVLQISCHARQANTPTASPARAVVKRFISSRRDLKFRFATANLKFQNSKA